MAIEQEAPPPVAPGEKPMEIHLGANDPETLFYVIAMNEERAREILRLMAGKADALKVFLSGLRMRINLVLLAQQEAAG